VQYGRYNQGGELDIFSTANEIKEEPVNQTIVEDSLPLTQTIPTLAGIKKKEPMKQAKPLEQKMYEEIFVRIKQLSKANELLFKEKSPNWGTVATLANLHSALGYLLEDGYAKHFGYSKTLEEGLKRHHDANKELLQTITSKAKDLKKNNELMTISDWWGYLSRQADFLGQFLDIGTRESEKESPTSSGKVKRKLLPIKSNSGIVKKVELAISLEELAIEMLPKGADSTEILSVIYEMTSKVEDTATKLAQQYIVDEKVKAIVKSLNFEHNDSDNISHGASYFNLEIQGSKNELKKIAGPDKIFYCEW
jgi:hypothetical protein